MLPSLWLPDCKPQALLLCSSGELLVQFETSKFVGETNEGITLADVPPGSQVEVVGFSDNFPADRKAYLQAYGLVMNHQVQVVQHTPVTIIRLDNIELALENDLAKGIMVRPLS